jgi:dTDP-glucose 4,6-dehydratase
VPQTLFAATKAASDHLVRSWHNTYGLPVTLSLCSNNYGPYHFPENLIPFMITNALDSKPLPVYGKGDTVHDWLYVYDHAEAVWRILTKGRVGESYTIGGDSEWKNIDLVKQLCAVLARATNRREKDFTSLITFVEDAPVQNFRYVINCDKIKNELGFKQSMDFTKGLELTVRWYLDNQAWVEEIRSGEYARWIEDNYGKRKWQRL